mgnify:CR=1 FL=1
MVGTDILNLSRRGFHEACSICIRSDSILVAFTAPSFAGDDKKKEEKKGGHFSQTLFGDDKKKEEKKGGHLSQTVFGDEKKKDEKKGGH